MTAHNYSHRIAITVEDGMLIAAAPVGANQNLLLVTEILKAPLKVFPVQLFDVDLFDGAAEDEANLSAMKGEIVYRSGMLGNLPEGADVASGELVREIEGLAGIEDLRLYVDDSNGDFLDLGTSSGSLEEAMATLDAAADDVRPEFANVAWQGAELVIRCAGLEVCREPMTAPFVEAVIASVDEDYEDGPCEGAEACANAVEFSDYWMDGFAGDECKGNDRLWVATGDALKELYDPKRHGPDAVKDEEDEEDEEEEEEDEYA